MTVPIAAEQHGMADAHAPDAASRQATPSRLPPASLIVCSRNRPQLLAEAIASILAGTQVPDELIIVDQSDTASPALAALKSERGCDIRYVWTRSVGLSRANNTGIAAARHEVLVFTHDDVWVERAWFETIVRAALDAGPRGVVTGQVKPTAARTPGGFAPSAKVDDAPAVYAGRLNVDVLYPLNMALPRSAFAEVGGFDERLGPGTPFPGAEDSDLGFRLLEAGYRIHYVPAAVIYHRAWRTARDYLPLRWAYGCARGAFFVKHTNRRDWHMLRRMARDVLRLRDFPWRVVRERRRACGDVALAGGILYGAVRWWLTQHGIGAERSG